MELSPSKRRKISPSASVAATTLNTNTRPASRDGAPHSGPRASFLSPTKATLARFNPKLLPRAQSSEPRRSAGRRSPGLRPRTSHADSAEARLNGATGGRLGSEPPSSSAGPYGPTAEDRAQTPRNGLTAAPRRSSQTPNVHMTPLKLPETQPAHGTRALPPRSTGTAPQLGRNKQMNQKEMASQEDRPGNGVSIDESNMEKLPQTPTRHGLPAGRTHADGSEPSLPSTPSQLGLEAPAERPMGLLFGASSKRARRKEKGDARPSPLKPNENPSLQPPVKSQSASSLGAKVFLNDLPKPQPTAEQTELREKKARSMRMEKELLDISRGMLEQLLLSKWQPGGVKGRIGLSNRQRKVTDMSNKLLRLREVIDVLESSIDATTEVPVMDVGPNRDAAQSSDNAAISIPKSLAQKLLLFFPFHGAETSPDTTVLDFAHVKDVGNEAVPFSVRVFNSSLRTLDTRLTATNETSYRLRGQTAATDGEIKLLQKHEVAFMSSDETETATLQLTVDSKTQDLVDASIAGAIPDLHSELHEWLSSNERGKDLIILSTAIGRFWQVAQLRTRCWHSCQERFSDLVKPLFKDGGVHHKQTIVFQRKLVFLKIAWNITFKDDGEVESKVSARPEFPSTWLKDEAGSNDDALGDVQEAFSLLVRDRGVTEAIGVIVKLIFQSV